MTGGVIRIALIGEGADALSVPPFAGLDDEHVGEWGCRLPRGGRAARRGVVARLSAARRA
jgi:hypothetical protein